jgi:hypothetical protein
VNTRWHRKAAYILTALLAQGCVSVHAPLAPDEAYPHEWGELSALGSECKALEGTYRNDGVARGGTGHDEAISLTSVLNLRSDAGSVSLSLRTRRIDANGDGFTTLRIVLDGAADEFREHEGCFCIRQTLACTQISEASWALPNFGYGGSQRNAYFSVSSSDGSLIAKLQNYHADVILAIPVFGIREPWARFQKLGR